LTRLALKNPHHGKGKWQTIPKVTSHLNPSQSPSGASARPRTNQVLSTSAGQQTIPAGKEKKILEQGQRNPRAAGARIRLGNLLRI